jgi:hypothetical protein
MPGEDYLMRVDACIQAICRTPELHQVIFKNYRRGLVRRFPYAVFYKYEGNLVTVFCVVHTSRNPEVWQQRLSN